MSEDPAIKYREKVDPEHINAMQAIGMSRLMMMQYQGHFEKLIKARDDMDNVGAVLNPTLYRDVLYSKSFAQQMRMVKAALAFLNEINAVVGEIEGGAK